MKCLGFPFTLVFAFSFVLMPTLGLVDASHGWWNSSWQYRQNLTFDNSGQTQDLVDFPVLVRLTPTNIDYSKTQNNGQDIRFVDSDDATELAYEIEKWNETGESLVWVKVPQINGSSSTDRIHMYYGNPSASDGQNPTVVWDGNFKLVHHLQETSGTHYDSTSNDNDATPQGGVAMDATGRINGADGFDGTNDYASLGTSSTLNFGLNSPFTIEGWFRTTESYGPIVSFRSSTNGGPVIDICVGYDGAVNDAGSLMALVRQDGGGGGYARRTGPTTNDGNWHYFALTRNAGNTIELFSDGISQGTASGSQSGGAITTNIRALANERRWVQDGYGSVNQRWLNGAVDEVRVSDTTRSTDWIRAQFLSMTDAFITYGGKEEHQRVPSVTTKDASIVTSSSTRLCGRLDDLGTAPTVDVSFQWGETSGGPYLNETTPQTMNAPGVFSFDLTNLKPNTTYFYRAKAVGDGVGYGTELTFTTPKTPPSVSSACTVPRITSTSARLCGRLDDLGTAPTVDVSFQWGETSDGPYLNETTPQTMNAPGLFSFNLTNLNPVTTYYYRAKAVGDSITQGNENNFTTLRSYYLNTNLFGARRSFRVTVTGELLETMDITSEDGMLAIKISNGTVAMDKDGNRLRTLEVTLDENPAPPSDDAHIIVGPTYNFAPKATLNRAMTLTWGYDRSALPEGVKEQDLILAYYDESVDRWIEHDFIGDFVSQTITAKISHLTIFALLGFKPAPAVLTIGGLSIFPKKVNIGENVAINVSIANSGGLAGSYNLALEVNNSMVAGIEGIIVPGGARQMVTFTISRDTPGTYFVRVNGLMDSFKVRDVAPIPAAVALGLASYLFPRKRRDAKRLRP